MEYWCQNEEINKTYDTLYGLIEQYDKHKNDKDTTIKKIIIELIKEHTKHYIQISGTTPIITENKNINKIMDNIYKEIQNAIPRKQNPVP